jgi:extracellular elastinolytic metalloproteinase
MRRRDASAFLALAVACALVPATALAREKPVVQPQNLDARALAPLSGTAANASRAVLRLRRTLGREGIVSVDAATGTPRVVARLDGFLTAPSGASAAAIARGYLLRQAAVFRLSPSDISALSLRRDYVSIDGTHHLSFVQSVDGIPVFGNGVRVNVAKDGRIINVLDAPVSGLPTSAAAPTRTPASAILAARASVTGSSAPAGTARDDSATQVLFHTASGTQLAWQVLVHSADGLSQQVVADRSGQVLYRQSLTSHASGLAVDYYPGAPAGGTQLSRDFTGAGWLADGATTLSGNNTHTYSDVNDDDVAQADEEVGPSDASGNFDYPIVTFNSVNPACSDAYPCTWDPSTAFSWQTNRAEDATQVFYYVNFWHDHLAAAPIGFTEAAGNFQVTNSSGQGVGGDPVLSQNDDGANTDAGFPDGNHIDNANMSTPPDGQAPTMQMYLVHFPGDDTDPFLPIHGGDDALTVYHEYTHGLSNRLVVDAAGNSTLGGFQAGAMGEAWSDWYAFDSVVRDGFAPDTAADGELDLDVYWAPGQIGLSRIEPIDCSVGSTAERCPGNTIIGGDISGGFTYADYGKIIGGPEVHADGEIWGQTLWDLRTALGSDVTEGLVTRAMELSPSNPSFLDERNAILQADMVDFGGAHRDTIWQVFAHRGMGFFAAATSGDDAAPVANFDVPPPLGSPTGRLVGNVRDRDSGAPIKTAVVQFGGHASGFADDLVSAITRGSHYEVRQIPLGTYPDIVAKAPGYDTSEPVTATIERGQQVQDFQLRRDWAAGPGGATIASSSGDAFDCPASFAIDQSPGNGWIAPFAADGGELVPQQMTVALPTAVDISRVGIDPSPTCGFGTSAQLKEWRLETSTDGVTFTTAAQGSFRPQDDFRLNLVRLSAGAEGVRFVRLWVLSNHVPGGAASCPGPFTGCRGTSVAEVEVYGRGKG